MPLTHRYVHVVVVAFIVFAVGCNQPTPTPTTTKSSAPKAPTGDRDPYEGQTVVDLKAEAIKAKRRLRNAESLSHREIIERGESAILYIVVRDATGADIASGTGFLIDSKGYVATNHHVLEEAVDAKVQTRDGTELSIRGVVGSDPDHDIVIFQLNEVPDGMQPLKLISPEGINQGDDVTAIGHPAGFQYTATNGIVSAIRKSDELPEDFREMLNAPASATWIQTSAAISGGNSGGPLMNEYGDVIGINTWIAQGQNLGFAIHVDHVIDVLNSAASEPTPLPLPGSGTITDPQVAALNLDFEREYMVFLRAQYDDDSDAEEALRKVFDGSNPFTMYGKKYMDLAEKHPKSETAAQALVQAAKLLSRSDDLKSRGHLLTIIDELQENYLDNPWISEAAVSLAGSAEPKVIELQKSIIQRSANHDAKGIACYSLATNLVSRNHALTSNAEAGAGDSQPEYLALIRRAVEEFGDVRLRGSTLKSMLGPHLAASQTADGMVAPNIEGPDLFDVQQKLSDHRGKVVVLDFWVDWCPYCRQMYPENVKLVEKYKDNDSFALLGVNNDQQRLRATQAHALAEMNYPSWFDGDDGKITEAWGIQGYPSIVILDKRGVIRAKLSTTDFETLDKVVTHLMSEDQSVLGGDILPRGSDWKYCDSPEAPPADWNQAEFSESNWQSGAAPLGFGVGETTTLTHEPIGTKQPMACYFRNQFEISDLDSVSEVVLEAYFDDGIVIYLNGEELARRFVTVDATHETPAALPRKRQGRQAKCIPIPKSLMKQGTNTIAVAVHQATEWSADLQFDLSISSGVLPKLREHLKSGNASRRDVALRYAAQMGSEAKPLADVIKPMLTSAEPALRDDAYSVMLAMNPRLAAKSQPPKLKRFQEIGERKQRAMTLNNVSWAIVEVPGLSSHDYLEAHRASVVADKLRPKYGMILNTKALALVRLGKHTSGLKVLSSARKIHGKKPSDYLVACIAYHGMGKKAKAQSMYRTALKIIDEIKRPELTSGLGSLIDEAKLLVGE